MADGITLNPGTGGQTVSTDELPSGHVQRIKLMLGGDNVDGGTVATSNPMPVAGPLTDAQLRAAPLSVTASGTVSVSNFPTMQEVFGSVVVANFPGTQNVAVPGGVAISNFPASQTVTGTINVGNLPATQPVSGPLTNGELRASPVEVFATSAVPVSAASLPLPTGAATQATLAALEAKVPALSSSVPSNEALAIPVRTIGQDVWAASFSAVGASVLSADFRAPDVGTGVTYNQGSGALNIVAGTTANAEFLTRSVASWRGAMAVRFSLVASQRIANNNLAVLLADLVGENLACTINSATSITVTRAGHGLTAQNVGQFMLVGGITGAAGVPGRYAIASVPTADTINFTVAGWPASGSCTVDLFGHSYIRHLYTGATATNVAVDAQRRGWATGDTTATINTTASPGHIMQAQLDGRSLFWADALRISSATPAFTVRGSRYENIPDENLDLHLFIWSYNGTAAPASSTTWTISFVSIERFANTPVFIQGMRAMGAANPLPVAFPAAQSVTLTANTPTLAAGTNLAADVSLGVRTTATNAALSHHFVSAASANNATIKASAGRVYGWALGNNTASWRYLKLHNIATSPTAGTGVIQTIAIPPNGVAQLFNPIGFSYATGIGRTCVANPADADTTAIGANEVVGEIFFA